MQVKYVLLVISATMATVLAQGHQGGGYGYEEHGNDQAGYKFAYGIQDPHTHDVHAQQEHRDGKQVIGEYTLNEADGTQRIVKYVSNPHTGFEAIVERKGHAQHPAHYGKHGEKGGVGGTSYVGITHWSNQGHNEQEHGH
ncbi:hypothetical protein NQ314_010983 [Rhamnusium bicolor]|uniref:Uncharacterized protein n=1 Tax=Rhamnusium bicolor TaxID=1586634 RepID=A0AAV8XMY4_9CUCU|nr:hypothetical protein NQ314_010983 [Rhamnusium bicolor]